MVKVLRVEAPGAKADKDNDYAEVALLHDAFGLTAKFDDATGEPLTVLKVRVDVNAKKRYDNPDPKKTPFEIWDLGLKRKKGSGAPMGQNPVVVLEKASLAKGGDEVLASFIVVAERTFGSKSEMAVANLMMTVYPERKFDGGSSRQDRRIFFPENAKAVGSEDELKATLVKVLGNPDDYPGTTGALIRLIGTEVYPTESEPNEQGEIVPQYPYQAIAALVNRMWMKDLQREQTPEEAVDAFYTRTYKDNSGNDVLANERMIKLLRENIGNPNVLVEVIPVTTIKTGPQSLPSAKEARMGDERLFEYDWENPETGAPRVRQETGEKFKDYGIALGHMILGRVLDSDGGEPGPWFAKKSFTTRSYTPLLFQPRELITPNLPEPVAKVLMDQAERRKNARFSDNDKKETRDHDDRIKMDGQGAPDYSGGRMAVGR